MRLTEAIEYLRVIPEMLADRKESFAHLMISGELQKERRRCLRERRETALFPLEAGT